MRSVDTAEFVSLQAERLVWQRTDNESLPYRTAHDGSIYLIAVQNLDDERPHLSLIAYPASDDFESPHAWLLTATTGFDRMPEEWEVSGGPRFRFKKEDWSERNNDPNNAGRFCAPI